MRRHRHLKAGFTLVEVAIVLVIGGMMLTAAGATMRNYMLEASITTTQSRMKAVDTAIRQYFTANGKYPCPASLIAIPDTPAYGTITDCNSSALPSGTFIASTPAGVIIGAVPTRALNLGDQYMDDGWGSRFLYAVTQAQTTTPFKASNGAITVVDSNNNPIAGMSKPFAHYIILSHGRNRIGAYTHQGKRGLPCPGSAAATVTLEKENCDNNAVFRQTLNIGTAPGAKLYDDYLLFHSTASDINLTAPVFQGSIILYDKDTYNGGIDACPGDWQKVTDGLPGVASNYIWCLKP